MRCQIFLFIVVSFTLVTQAEEMPLPFSSQTTEVESDLSPTRVELFDQVSPIDLFGEFDQSAVGEIDMEVFSSKSLGRFLRQPRNELAQLGTDFPTDYMQDPELGEPPAAPAIIEGTPEPTVGSDEAPPAPEEVEQLFPATQPGPEEPQSLPVEPPRVQPPCTGEVVSLAAETPCSQSSCTR